ncbi:hypothetical protein LSAT2_006873, partial [Lamellibrachia satsuma]
MRDATIVTLYKNKGDRSDFNNYRGISLLSIVGKAFARVLLIRLQKLASRVYPESQCRFRAGRSTIDMIFSVRQLQEKCREQGMPLYVAFIDLTMAFDLVSRKGLFRLLEKISCPPKLCSMVASFHENMKGTVVYDGSTSEPFPVCSGVKINDYTLEVVEDFTYLGSNISNNLSLDKEINRRIGKAACTMAKLTKRVWENKMLTENTKMRIYQACVLSTLLYGSESWTTYMCQERRLNTFHMRCLKRILGITWQDRIPYSDILDRARIRSMHSLLSQRRLRWLGHVRRMEDGRLPKDILYGQLTSGVRPVGCPALRFKDACNRDMKA